MVSIKGESSEPGLEMGKQGEVLAVNEEDVKPTYKSFKKKYRKMRIKFDDVMRESNHLVVAERQGEETSARLAIEIDRLMELLLDVNSSAQIPVDKRIDLDVETPALSPVPDLITSEENARLAFLGAHKTPVGAAIHEELRPLLANRSPPKTSTKPSKSLAQLLSTVPHLNFDSPQVPSELKSSFAPLDGHNEPIAYLTLDSMDEYLYELDANIGVPSTLPLHPQPPPIQLDLALQNPHSVYNWLRHNKPNIFLQDGEGSEKSNGKPGSLRGAGKRSSMPAPSKPDALEIVVEDGMGYDPTISGLEPTKSGKRKRDEDGGYHPKSGSSANGKAKKPRPKKAKVEGDATPASKKKKTKEKVPSPMAVDLDTPRRGV